MHNLSFSDYGAHIYDVSTSIASNTFYKTSFSVQGTSASEVISGGTVLNNTISSGATTGVNLQIGFCNYFGGYLNGYIKKLSYYPIAVTSANLIALTGS